MFVIPSASFGCINAMLHQTFLFLGQLWQLFEVSQILEFLRYAVIILSDPIFRIFAVSFYVFSNHRGLKVKLHQLFPVI